MIITRSTDGGGLHDGGLLQRFITGIFIIISLLYITVYLKIKVMKGKISYEEKLLDLLLEQEYATFAYAPLTCLKYSDRIAWLN